MPIQLSYRQEVYRKCIHIASSIIPIFLFYYGADRCLPWILAITIFFLSFDYLRRRIPTLKHFYFALFGKVIRPQENKTLSGAAWVFMGASITIFMTSINLFSERAAVIALLVMSWSDSAAAIIGIKYGATKLFNKSLEGTLAFFITTYVIISLLAPLSFIKVFITTICSTIVELFSFPELNDNISIPVVTAAILTFLGVK